MSEMFLSRFGNICIFARKMFLICLLIFYPRSLEVGNSAENFCPNGLEKKSVLKNVFKLDTFLNEVVLLPIFLQQQFNFFCSIYRQKQNLTGRLKALNWLKLILLIFDNKHPLTDDNGGDHQVADHCRFA